MKEEIRQELISFLERYGSTCSFIAKQVDMSRETISRFKNGKTEILSEDYCLRIKRFLDNL